MKITTRIKNAVSALTRPVADLNEQELLEWLGISGVKKNILSEVTYYTCLKMLSETMGKLPLKYYQSTEQEDPGRPDTHDKPFDGSPERDHDTDDSVEHYGNELSALRKWVSLDPARIQPTRCIRRRLCST